MPRQASWRLVVCPHCGSTVTRLADVVQRAVFSAALERSRAIVTGRGMTAGSATYSFLHTLGRGASSEVFLAERVGTARARVVVKIARDEAGAARLAHEGRHLGALQALSGPGASYFTRRLPQPVFAGIGVETGGASRTVLVTRHLPGFTGSLAAVAAAQPAGIDARHVVWMWRRVLEVLAFVHRSGWTHGDITPAHLLVQPADHGMCLIGWARASSVNGAAFERVRQRDLAQLAWSLRAVLRGAGDDAPTLPARTPAPLAALLRSASEDSAWQAAHSAEAVEAALTAAASASFGAPRFVPFEPFPAT